MRALALALVLAVPALAQTVTPRGADGTFDVAAWNIEHFGDPGFAPSDPLQISNTEAIVEQAEIDLWAVQEIGSQDAWESLLTRLQADGYQGRLGPETPGSFQLRLGFLYDPDVVTVIGTRTILSGGNFGGRLPFEMQARVSIGGQARTIRVISLHAKAGTGADDYADRVAGAAELKTYIDDRLARGDAVILLGDYNDFLTRTTRSGESVSPYAAFLSDADYFAPTLGIEQQGIPTLCGNSSCTTGSTRDHILVTSNLSAEYVEGSGDRYSEVISEVSGFVNTTSDHVPVLARFEFRPVGTDAAPEDGVALLAPAPSPFRASTRVRFRLAAPADVAVEVFDVLGRRVAGASGAYGVGEHGVTVDGSALAPGAYLVRLAADGVVQTQRVVRAR